LPPPDAGRYGTKLHRLVDSETFSFEQRGSVAKTNYCAVTIISVENMRDISTNLVDGRNNRTIRPEKETVAEFF
jgi:hypothetical protein